MRVCGNGKYRVYIYADHPPPHCHVRTAGTDLRVMLPTLEAMDGQTLKKDLRNLLLDNLDRLCEKWSELNPTDNNE
jgi:hypothetical protein